MPPAARQSEVSLKRSLGLPLLVLYGLGVTIGAGIYVLVGATAGHAGTLAPWSFALAATVMAFTAFSFGELATRFPVSAGEAAYVREGLRSNLLSTLTGGLVITVGTVSSAAIAVGCAGYLREFVDLPLVVLVPAIVLAIGAVSAWGILESVMLAAVFTLIEVGGLLAIVAAALYDTSALVYPVSALIPTFDLAAWAGIVSAGLIAFFAFIGFEDLVNVAEEAHDPVRDMPAAIIATLVISAVIYVAVVSVSVLAVPMEVLSTSQAPLADVFRHLTATSPVAITVIAVFATANTLLVQMIMVVRVIYGMVKLGSLPKPLGVVSAVTRTPLRATVLVALVVGALAMAAPLDGLARATSTVSLTVFTLVNLALVRLKLSGDACPHDGFTVPVWVPVAGTASCIVFLTVGLIAS